ncbi:MAG: hypothetical protein ACE5IR_24915 [bacterium]
MGNAPRRGQTTSSHLDGYVGVHNLPSLDELLRVESAEAGADSIPCSLVKSTLSNELATHKLAALFRDFRSGILEDFELRDFSALLLQIPKKIYFFLWHLRNSDLVPLEGMLTSQQLKTTIYYLAKYLAMLELFLKKTPNSIPLYENLGYTHLDLAGIAQYAPNGLFINGKQLRYTTLLRKAITCFQIAIKLEAYHGKEVDVSHLNILRLMDEKFDFNENRTLLYVNPWNFLYIASTLQLLNDRESFTLYLEKARSILSSVCDHQNRQIRQQKDLLESVYATLKYGSSVWFDFDKKKLAKLRQRLKRIRNNKTKSKGERSTYSPFVEEALLQQHNLQSSFLKHGVLDSDQTGYLHGIFTLYNEIQTSSDRDQLIYRMNIPPLKVKGTSSVPSLRRLQTGVSTKKAHPSNRQLNSPNTP